ncbi:hypothetical protein [Paraconexibacter sp. AEG42_29]|uniref:hypothetical protein n=1 Tax=Paraconexibacter sp. AEG42_29 TaxID=2997339 RepID=UPI00339D56AC
MSEDFVAAALVAGLRPHLPAGVTLTAFPGERIGLRFREAIKPSDGHRSSSPLTFDLVEATADNSHVNAVASAVRWILSSIQTEVSEWVGYRWPEIPESSSASGGGEAYAVPDHEKAVLLVGLEREDGWSLRIAQLPIAEGIVGRR